MTLWSTCLVKICWQECCCHDNWMMDVVMIWLCCMQWCRMCETVMSKMSRKGRYVFAIQLHARKSVFEECKHTCKNWIDINHVLPVSSNALTILCWLYNSIQYSHSLWEQNLFPTYCQSPVSTTCLQAQNYAPRHRTQTTPRENRL